MLTSLDLAALILFQSSLLYHQLGSHLRSIGRDYLAMVNTPWIFVPLNALTHRSVPGSPWKHVGAHLLVTRSRSNSPSLQHLRTGHQGMKYLLIRRYH